MDPTSRPSLIGRALLALLLTIGFYGLALGIAFGLLYLIYLQFAVFGRVNARLTIFAFIGAMVILWSILPRVDRFTAPGPQLTRNKFPALFKEIERVAQRTGQEMPREVYLLSDVNAFVAERGGFMGIGRRRVMGIGLPLIHLLTVDEFNAVLAHEFGHYFGGDTALGPWIYKTREAIIRTTMNLAQANQWLYIPFEAYAKMFLRVTNAVSRQQELTADKLSADIVGSAASISGLQKVHKYGQAFGVFFQQEYAPALNGGYRPPMMEGFRMFLRSPNVLDAVNKNYQQQLAQGTTNPYDSHPSLKERIAALENIRAGATINDHPASSLLPVNDDLEMSILRVIMPQKEKVDVLKSIAWEDVAEIAFAPQWGQSTERFKPVFSDITPQGLFDAAQDPSSLFMKLASTGNLLSPDVKPEQVPQDAQAQIMSSVIGAALASALRRNGWKIRTSPGEDLFLANRGVELNPFTIFPKLMGREFTRQQWIEYCDQNGISDLKLG